MVSTAPPLNKLLAALPPRVYDRLQPHLELVPLKLGASVYEAGGKQPFVYFPTDSIVSLLYVMKDGASAEIAVVGNTGSTSSRYRNNHSPYSLDDGRDQGPPD